MLVAVHPWDIEGARSAGLSTAWINRSGARFPAYFGQPDFEATSVLNLARLLGPGRRESNTMCLPAWFG